MALSAGSVEIRLFAELARLQSDMKKANKVVEDAMGCIQKTIRSTTSLFNNMAASFGASQIIKLADDYKRFDAQLKLSTKSLNEYNEAYKNVIRIGRTAQSDIGAIGVLYARLNNNLRDFNVTQRQVADVTETISLALRTNNATVQETNSVMLQLSQSFGSGKLNGQEFLAVAEGAPMLLRQLANSLKLPFGALKDLSAQGKITREDLLKAWSDPAYIAALRQQVKEVGTLTSAVTVLMNNLKQYIGEADKATGATKSLSWLIVTLADNINLLVSGAIAYGVVAFTKWAQSQYAALAASRAASAQKVIAAKVELSLAQAAYASGTAVTRQTAAMANNAAATTLATSNTARLIAAQRGLAAATSTTAAAARGFSAILSTFGGWVGLAITGVILFADKLLSLYDRVRGLTPELKALNDEMERRNRLENIGVNAASKSAEQEEALVGQVKLYNEINAQIVRQKSLIESRKGFGLNVDKENATLATLEKRLRAQAALMGTNLTQANSLTPAINQNAEAFGKLSEKLQTAKELADEYAKNQALIIIEGSKAGLSHDEIKAKLKLLKEEYDKATGATKASKQATKDATEAEKERAEGIKQLALEQKAFVDAQNDARNAVILDAAQENEALAKQIEKTQERIELLNMGEDAQNRMVEARLQDAIATAEQNVQQAINNGATQDAIKYAEDYLFALKERLDLQKKLTKVEAKEERIKAIKAAEKARVEETKRANKEIEDANDRLYKNLARSITDSIVRGFENGLSFVDNFKKALTNAFKSFVVNIGVNVLQAGLSQLFGALTKTMLGSIMAATSSVANASTLTGTGNDSMFGVIRDGIGSLNSNIVGGIKSVGQYLSDFGSAGTGFFKDISSQLGSSIQLNADAIADGFSYAGALFQAAQGNYTGAIGTGIGTYFAGPVGGAIGSLIGGAVGGLFGGGHVSRPKYYANTAVTNTGSNLINAYGNSDASGTGGDVAINAGKGLADAIIAYTKAFGGTVSDFTLGTHYQSKYNTYSASLGSSIAHNGSNALDFIFRPEQAAQAAALAFFKSVKQGLVTIPDYLENVIVRSSITLDNALESANALGTLFSMRKALTDLPPVFNAIAQVIDTTLTLDKIDELQTRFNAINTYTSLFYSDTEKFVYFTKQVTSQFSALNMSVPESRDAFRELVDAVDVTTESGMSLFNSLIDLAPTMDAYYKQLEAELAIKQQLVALDINRFKTFTDFVIANSYVRAEQPIPAANMPSYDVGTSYVPRTGAAMIHQGERILTRSENADMTMNSGKAVSLLTALVDKVSSLEYDMKRTADGTQRTARELEDITGGDVVIMTQVA